MEAQLLAACGTLKALPTSDLPEIAIVGRSNCGKSSLINAITARRRLARTSSTPGRTRQLFFYRVTAPARPPFVLVDLPGYGYAKAPKSERDAWAPLIEGYIEERRQLRALLVLCDVRRDLGPDEAGLLTWAGARELERRVVLTKADKLSKAQRFGAAERAKAALGLAARPLLVSTEDDASIEALREAVYQFASAATP
ncbi:MAG: YihA family ribosome biogenesis GTP-binding protein [Deltaproteobacteria bacterium]|nr:YihA family ribosome biogenesis GTP-binding protein [Deltaproteobacteria bacterium]